MASPPPPPPYTKRRSPPPPPKPTTKNGFLGKSVLFALFLLALPLFPSQAPDFVAETVFTKFWELIHLLFVGIAVAYGLFSRRNVESGGGNSNSSRVDESSLSYVSRIFPVSSVFDEEFENEFGGNVSSSSVKERKSDEIEEEVNEVRAWNSQYFQARSKVVVARPAYGLDGHVVHQPLGLPIRSLRSGLRDNVASEEPVFSENVESLVEESFDEVIATPPSPVVPWEMMGMGDNYPSNFQPLPVDETRKSTSSRSSGSSSSRNSFVSRSQDRFSPARSEDRFSPARSVSEESLNSNVEEPVQETSLQGSSSRSSSPPLPPSPPLTPAPPSPELTNHDDSHRPILHSRHYSDGSVLEEDVRQGFKDELEENKVRGRRKEIYSNKEPGSKSLKLNAESSRRRNKTRRSYPPESVSSPTDDTTVTRRRHLHQKSDDKLFENSLGSDFNSHRIKKGRSQDSLELRAEDGTKDKKFSESFPHLDVLFQPTNAKASRRAMRSSRGDRDTLPERVVTRHSEDDSMNKDLPGFNKELKSNSLGSEVQSWRSSSKVPLRGKSVRTIRSDRHGKDRKKEEVSSDDRAEAKVETRGRTKSRRQQQEELAIVLHQEKTPEPPAESEPEEDITEETEAAVQPQVTLEEEEEAAWESQSNASHDHNEVDRKAGEFIAKFREQIRLQKLTSGEQPRGGGGGGGSTSNMRERHFR